MDFVCFDNLYKPIKPDSGTLIKDNDILYVRPKDVNNSFCYV